MNNDAHIIPILKNFNLQKCGLNVSVNIIGSLEIILSGINFPIVFLIDEEHHNDLCTQSNVLNALELINKASVNIIGVESHQGGYIWDDDISGYTSKYENGRNQNPVNDYPKFSEQIGVKYPNLIYGVECLGMLNRLDCNRAVDDNEWYGKPIKDNPLNRQRSEHFIRTLFELYAHHNLGGNLILNVGGNHNSDIENWIKDESIERRVHKRAAYVRLRVPEYKDHSL